MTDQIFTRATFRQRGATAYDRGLSVDSHGMNPGAAAIADWQQGWFDRRDQVAQAKYDRLTRPQVELMRER